VAALHAARLAHGDVTSSNVLLSDELHASVTVRSTTSALVEPTL
jgi:tRNA A-37 threonylcarbamoyl transferase component Bud32